VYQGLRYYTPKKCGEIAHYLHTFISKTLLHNILTELNETYSTVPDTSFSVLSNTKDALLVLLFNFGLEYTM
jgi:hypothetical protein